MTESTKITFRYRQIDRLDDITDLAELLFPGNRNQQHAAARILLELKAADALVPSMAHLESKHQISRRTLQRARAKLSRLGLIERVSWMNTRYGGREGWKLSTRFSSGMRRLADTVEAWRKDQRPERTEKDRILVEMLRAPEEN